GRAPRQGRGAWARRRLDALRLRLRLFGDPSGDRRLPPPSGVLAGARSALRGAGAPAPSPRARRCCASCARGIGGTAPPRSSLRSSLRGLTALPFARHCYAVTRCALRLLARFARCRPPLRFAEGTTGAGRWPAPWRRKRVL